MRRPLIKKIRFFLRPLRRVLELMLGHIVLKYHNVTLPYRRNRPFKKHTLPQQLVVSLTSYTPRFATLKPTLECMLYQTMKPDYVILWLAQKDYDNLPQDILDLQSDGLDIRITEDLRSYKKLIPALINFPNAFIITVDDDLYYRPTLIEELVQLWNGDYKQILCHKVNRIKFEPNTLKPLPYNDWEWQIKKTVLKNDILFPLSGSGVLHPPSSLNQELTVQKDIFLKLAPYADDIWLFFMGRIAGSYFSKTNDNRLLVSWPSSQDVTLASMNSQQNKNDEQIKNLLEYFPNFFENLNSVNK